ncbi:uncharacterized protein LOC130012915 [Patella vulgata]|uniref:uncharacterized protein LOC130012915 n=1 Tax=Patella vulgata TaxID=6465 RepID=UPI0024A7B48E|nr:uncharacterized protein LOC130012915 [Patella vulgata]
MKIASSLERCVEKLAETNKEQNELNRQLVSCTQLPKLDVPVFDGDPLKYPSWKHAFTALIDSNVSNVDSKLSYLRKYIGDDPKGPKALVEHYLLLGTEDAYRKAIEDRYGSLPDQDGREHSMIVPVWIRHRANPSKEFLEYLVVDDQSNVGFVGDNVCDKLNITGPETNLRLSTMHGSNKVIHSRKIYDLEVLDFKREHIIQLPGLFTRDSIPASRSQIPKQEVFKQWSHLKEVADQLMPYSNFVFNTKVKEIFDGERLLRIMETDFTDILRKPYSVEDEKFLKTLEDGIKKRPDGHYEMPLPLKSSNVSLPNNYKLALKRWNQLTGRFRKNPKFLADYQAFMKDLIDNCAERVPRDRLNSTESIRSSRR